MDLACRFATLARQFAVLVSEFRRLIVWFGVLVLPSPVRQFEPLARQFAVVKHDFRRFAGVACQFSGFTMPGSSVGRFGLHICLVWPADMLRWFADSIFGAQISQILSFVVPMLLVLPCLFRQLFFTRFLSHYLPRGCASPKLGSCLPSRGTFFPY